MDDLFGCGLRLVTDTKELIPDTQSLAGVGATAVLLGSGGFVESGAPSALDRLARHEVHAALVRPGQYVFGTARNRTGVHQLPRDFARAIG